MLANPELEALVIYYAETIDFNTVDEAMDKVKAVKTHLVSKGISGKRVVIGMSNDKDWFDSGVSFDSGEGVYLIIK